MSSSVSKNILTSGGWVKLKHLSRENSNGDKIRVYLKPEHNIECAIEAIKSACTCKPNRKCELQTLERELETKIYLLRSGELLKLVEGSHRLSTFFIRILHYKVENKEVEKPLPQFFQSWFDYLRDVHHLCYICRPSSEDQHKLFFYLAHLYQYNAPFSQEENERLDYQTSPLALADRNSYLRSSQTIWMRLASELVYTSLSINKKTSIIWIDHLNFVSFLGQFYQVEEVSLNKKIDIQKIVSEWLKNCSKPRKPLYFLLRDLPLGQKHKLEEARKFTNKTLEEITEGLKKAENCQAVSEFFHDPLPEKLMEAAIRILKDGGAGKKGLAEYETKETLDFLKKRYGRNIGSDIENFLIQIDKAVRSNNWEKGLIEKLFGYYNKNKKCFSGLGFKKPEELQKFLEKGRTNSEDFIEKAKKFFPSKSDIKFEDYFKAFQQDIKKNCKESSINAKDFVGIFYFEEFHGLKALISCQGGKSIANLVKIVGNLGYSPDASRFLRSFLRGYPSFFPHLWQPSFLDSAVQAKWNSLPKSFQENIQKAIENLKSFESLSDHPGTIYLNSIRTEFSTKYEKFTSATETDGPDWLHLYKEFINKILSTVKAENPSLSPAAIFAIKQMSKGLQFSSNHKNDIHLFIRGVQDILEAWMLYLDAHPVVDNPSEVFKKALPSEPTIVHFTPYAMRSFTHILQALPNVKLSGKSDKLSVQVFNQSYFELISNMERFKEKANIIISQSDAEIKDCDIYFIDIHPNNAVEARLFAHNLSKIIQDLESLPGNCFRTLVVDVTLNALSSPEIKELIDLAKPMVESNQLNLVLVQSLTKFSQLGLDKLSGGFLAAYNTNQAYWKEFNDQLNALQDEEPVDTLTLQFFSCLTKYSPDLQQQYISLINKNTSKLYKMVLEKYQTLNVKLEKDFLALTCNTDLETCYLAFNSRRNLLTLKRDISSEEIISFTKDIITELFIPLAEWLDLPLTERMSIGFPLSSVNECMHAIRLTVGLERELLDKYADMITYICFVLNRESEPEFFLEFETNEGSSKKLYLKRTEYFREKVAIFKAMYPIPGKTSDPVCISEPVKSMRNARREFVLGNGEIKVLSYTEQSQYGGPVKQWRQTLEERELFVHYGVGNDIPVTDPQISQFYKCLIASCLTQRQITREREDIPENKHSVNITPYNNDHNGLNVIKTLRFDAFYYIRVDNSTWNRFGDYHVSYKRKEYKLSFNFEDQELSLLLDDKYHKDDSIFIKKGHEVFPISWLDTDEKWNFFSQGCYDQIRELPFTGHRYKPNINDETLIKLNFDRYNPVVIIERDRLVFKFEGVSLYRRKIGNKELLLEIDFWGVKDPVDAFSLRQLFWGVSFPNIKKGACSTKSSSSDDTLTIDESEFDQKNLEKVAKDILNNREAILYYLSKTPLKNRYTKEFFDSILSDQEKTKSMHEEKKKVDCFLDSFLLDSSEKVKGLREEFHHFFLSDPDKAQKCIACLKEVVVQYVKGGNYGEILSKRNEFMKASSNTQDWNKIFTQFSKSPALESDNCLFELINEMNDLFERELIILAENFHKSEFSAKHVLLHERDKEHFSAVVKNQLKNGRIIHRSNQDRQKLQNAVSSASSSINSSQIDVEEVLKKLNLTEEEEKTVISGYPIKQYIEQYVKLCTEINTLIFTVYQYMLKGEVDIERGLSLIGGGRRDEFHGMEQILLKLNQSLFFQPIQDKELLNYVINSFCQINWHQLVESKCLAQSSEFIGTKVKCLIEKVTLDFRLHLLEIKPSDLVEKDNSGGGDCLIYSYIDSENALDLQEEQQVGSCIPEADEVIKIRELMADEILNHLDDFEGIMDRFLSDQFIAYISKKLEKTSVQGVALDNDLTNLLIPYFNEIDSFVGDLKPKEVQPDTIYETVYTKLISKWQGAGEFKKLATKYANEIVRKQGKYLTSPSIEALARVKKRPIVVDKDGVLIPFGILYDATPVYIRNKNLLFSPWLATGQEMLI